MNVIPFQSRPTSQPSILEKIESYQKLPRQWFAHLKATEAVVLMVVLDRTLGWGSREAHFTAKQLLEGDKTYCGMAQMMSRATMFRALSRLEKLDIVRRRPDPKNPRRVYYSVNMGWEPSMLNMPKRLKNTKDSLTSETHVVSPMRLSKSHPCDTLYSKDTDTNSTDTISGSPAARPVPNPAEGVRETLNTAISAHRVAATARAAKSRTKVSSGGVQTAWRMALVETFPGTIHKAWSIREQAQVKGQVRNWLHAEEITFADFADWAVRNWSGIIAKQFKWMTQSPPPKLPNIGFFLSFLGQFAECWSEGKLDAWLASPERTEMEKLMASGMSSDEAAAEIGKRRAVGRMREENEKVRIEARSRHRQAQAVEKRILAIAEAGCTIPIHPRSRNAMKARGKLPELRKGPMSAEAPEIDTSFTLDPNWEPPL